MYDLLRYVMMLVVGNFIFENVHGSQIAVMLIRDDALKESVTG